jgi:hypothetical protein
VAASVDDVAAGTALAQAHLAFVAGGRPRFLGRCDPAGDKLVTGGSSRAHTAKCGRPRAGADRLGTTMITMLRSSRDSTGASSSPSPQTFPSQKRRTARHQNSPARTRDPFGHHGPPSGMWSYIQTRWRRPLAGTPGAGCVWVGRPMCSDARPPLSTPSVLTPAPSQIRIVNRRAAAETPVGFRGKRLYWGQQERKLRASRPGGEVGR